MNKFEQLWGEYISAIKVENKKNFGVLADSLNQSMEIFKPVAELFDNQGIEDGCTGVDNASKQNKGGN